MPPPKVAAEQTIDIPEVGLVTFPASMSDADITLVARRLHLDAMNKKPLSEPTDYESGRNASLLDTAKRTAVGVGRGVLQGVKTAANPFSAGEYLINAPGELATTAKDLATNRGRNTIAGLKTLSDPDIGGQVIGNLALGLAAPKALDVGRNVAVRGGAAMARTGEAMRGSPTLPFSKPGIVKSATGPILRTGGKILEQTGRAAGGEMFPGESSVLKGGQAYSTEAPYRPSDVPNRGPGYVEDRFAPPSASEVQQGSATYDRPGYRPSEAPQRGPGYVEDRYAPPSESNVSGGRPFDNADYGSYRDVALGDAMQQEMGTPTPDVSMETPTPAAGEPLPESFGPDAYAGPERRMSAGEGPYGVDRRTAMSTEADQPITGTIPERAAQMRMENPNIDAEAAAMRPDVGTSDLETQLTNGLMDEAQQGTTSQSLGTPRVLSWKEGRGPSTSDAQSMSAQFGSREAARRLKTTPDQIKTLRGPSASVLPEAARANIDAKIAMLKSDPNFAQLFDQYLQSAPNDLARAYIESKR